VSLGRVAGAEIRVDASVLVIVGLITWNLGVALSRWHPTWGTPASIAVGLLGALAYLASILLHELAHTAVARTHGVRVPTITLWLFGGVSSFEQEPPSPSAEFLTAIVGPLTSALLGAAFLVLGALQLGPRLDLYGDTAIAVSTLGPTSSILLWLGPVNLALAVFNLLPAFPLDGGRVLRSILWAIGHDLARATRTAARIGQGLGWALVAIGLAASLGVPVPLLGGGPFAGLWIALLGWFLAAAAMRSGELAIATLMLRGAPIGRLMRVETLAVPSDASLQAVVDTRWIRSDEAAFPVVDGERYLGRVSRGALRTVRTSRWPTTRVADVMTRGEATAVRPRDDAAAVFERMVREEESELPVVDAEGALAGVVHLRDLARWVALRDREGARLERVERASRPSRPSQA
jgi:Zn-dependent protease